MVMVGRPWPVARQGEVPEVRTAHGACRKQTVSPCHLVRIPGALPDGRGHAGHRAAPILTSVVGGHFSAHRLLGCRRENRSGSGSGRRFASDPDYPRVPSQIRGAKWSLEDGIAADKKGPVMTP